MRITRVLAIQNYGSSGTTLIQSLLDGHPNILCLPALHSSGLYGFWETYGNRPHAAHLKEFLDAHAYWFDPDAYPQGSVLGLHQMGKHMDGKVAVDKSRFEAALAAAWSALPELTRRDFIVSVFTCYNAVLGRPLADDVVLMYAIHSQPPRVAQALRKDFGEVKFLHMVREPVQNMGSGMKHIAKAENWQHLQLLDC